MTKSILLVGVGGQGTILASKLLTMGLMEAGYDVKMSEIHGMSQRGGSVSSQIRFGEKVFSPVIELGSADLLISFEQMEALRWIKYLKPTGKVVVNDYQINPMPVLSGAAEYPQDVLNQLSVLATTTVVQGKQLADEVGSGRVMNVVLLGTVVKMMGLENIDWEKIIRENTKEAFIDLNIQALKQGMCAVQVAEKEA